MVIGAKQKRIHGVKRINKNVAKDRGAENADCDNFFRSFRDVVKLKEESLAEFLSFFFVVLKVNCFFFFITGDNLY